MAQEQLKNSPINLRALASQKNLIDRAALLLNRSRSDFMLEAACKEAEMVLLNQRLFFTTEAAYQSFVSLLESPLEENEELSALLKSKSPWDK